MFASLESFSVFFFVSLAVILLGILFEEKLVAIENRITKKAVKRKKAGRQTKANNGRIQHNTAKAYAANRKPVRTQSRGFAA